jgi:proteasome lid subunit RPN8/RPN11
MRWVFVFISLTFFNFHILCNDLGESKLYKNILSSIEENQEIKKIQSNIDSYLNFCSNRKCKEEEYVNYLHLSYNFDGFDLVTIEVLSRSFLRKYNNSIFSEEINNLLLYKKNNLVSQKVIDSINTVSDISDLEIFCNRYNSIGAISHACTHKKTLINNDVYPENSNTSLSTNNEPSYFAPYSFYAIIVLIFSLILFLIYSSFIKRKEVSNHKENIPPNTELDNEDDIAEDKEINITTNKSFLFSNLFNDYVNIDLTKLWKDTQVETLLIKRVVIKQIYDQIIQPENTNMEIGGFLLGYFSDSEYHEVKVEQYLPINNQSYSEFQLEFNNSSWAELEKTLSQKKIKLVGWFHTHPGHGLFLSRPDINIVQYFFNKSYHVALEIDPVLRAANPNLDFGVFSKKSDGNINNIPNLSNCWYSWSDILKISGVKQ